MLLGPSTYSLSSFVSSFCSEVAPTGAEAVGDTDDDSTVVERGAAVEDGATDMVDIGNNQDRGSEIRLS